MTDTPTAAAPLTPEELARQRRIHAEWRERHVADYPRGALLATIGELEAALVAEHEAKMVALKEMVGRYESTIDALQRERDAQARELRELEAQLEAAEKHVYIVNGTNAEVLARVEELEAMKARLEDAFSGDNAEEQG